MVRSLGDAGCRFRRPGASDVSSVFDLSVYFFASLLEPVPRKILRVFGQHTAYERRL